MTATSPTPSFTTGSLVHARGREWVVLPAGDDPDVLLLRPLGGTDADAAGLYLPLEGDEIRSATLPPPDPAHVGDAVSAALLRDAVRLGFRSAAGPLRSLGRVAFEPRPYQLVPLLMALKQDPVRLLIADDVGIGKTIEAGLIVRELLDRGEIRRAAVLCPPHLCEQWESELREKFHIDAAVIRPGTVAALERRADRERGLDLSRSIFDEYPFVVVSIDYIKSDRRRDEFIQACPECLVVDEAHGVAISDSKTGAQQQRHRLVADLAADPQRHLILTTATPHSGDESAFASLLALLSPELTSPSVRPELVEGPAPNLTQDRRLAAHFVQRRRADIRRFLDSQTDFPARLTAERTYRLAPAYRTFLERVVDYAREVVRSADGGTAFHRRVSWWVALALLRCASSSPAAAAAALRTRVPLGDTGNPRDADALGAALVLDLTGSDLAAHDDTTPGADTSPVEELSTAYRDRLLKLARDAEALAGDDDAKLAEAIRVVAELLDDGFSPIVFCRYVATAHYVADALQAQLKRGITVQAVTGELPADERERRVEDLGLAAKRVLVATDCLSEGVNLQHHFDAVLHYDLSWNPTRHEQREGRVDRYGQPSRQVRTILLYGQDNRVDGVVLEVLLRKAENIRQTLGISVPVPGDTEKVLEAIFDTLFTRGGTDYRQLELFVGEQKQQLDAAWQDAADRESRTRTVFAQHALRPEEVRAELDLVRAAIGSAADVRRFVEDAVARLDTQPPAAGDVLTIDLNRLPAGVTGRLDLPTPLRAAFEPAVPHGATYLPRTHPFVAALAGYILDTAIDSPATAVARRAGAIRTTAVATRTVLLLLRARYLIQERRVAETPDILAEDTFLAAFTGDYSAPSWVSVEAAEALARSAQPTANVPAAQATLWLTDARDALPHLQPALDQLVKERARAHLESHRRVRQAARLRAAGHVVDPKLPADLLGLYVLMPAPSLR